MNNIEKLAIDSGAYKQKPHVKLSYPNDAFVFNAKELEAFAKAYAQQQSEPVAVLQTSDPYKEMNGIVKLLKAIPVGTEFYTHPPATVPEGYALVPIEPTEEMINVVLDFDYEWTNSFAPSKSDRLGVYKAMLSASPTPPNAVPLEKYNKLLDAHKQISNIELANRLGGNTRTEYHANSNKAYRMQNISLRAIAEAEENK